MDVFYPWLRREELGQSCRKRDKERVKAKVMCTLESWNGLGWKRP